MRKAVSVMMFGDVEMHDFCGRVPRGDQTFHSEPRGRRHQRGDGPTTRWRTRHPATSSWSQVAAARAQRGANQLVARTQRRGRHDPVGLPRRPGRVARGGYESDRRPLAAVPCPCPDGRGRRGRLRRRRRAGTGGPDLRRVRGRGHRDLNGISLAARLRANTAVLTEQNSRLVQSSRSWQTGNTCCNSDVRGCRICVSGVPAPLALWLRSAMWAGWGVSHAGR